MTTLLIVLTHLVVPLIFAIAVGSGSRIPSRLHWLGYLGLSVVYLAFIHMAGAWMWLGSFWPWLLWLVLAGSATWFGVRRLAELPLWPPLRIGPILSLGFTGGLIVVLVLPLWSSLWSGSIEGRPQALEWPLAEGRYHIGQGGNSKVMNHHYPVSAQRHALDVVRVGPYGIRGHRLLPQALEDYRIWETPVEAPCTGQVSGTTSEYPDLPPPERDTENPAGNFVALHCGNITVVLAHLQQDSVRVSAGDSVQQGDVLARVGNSGNTTEPHLHIHAVQGRIEDYADLMWEAEGVPMSFDGRYLVRNSVYRPAGEP